MPEDIEGTAIVVRESSVPAVWTPTFAIAVDEAIERKAQKQRFFRGVMTEGVHYGVIPGTGTKPTLLKPGAEMLLSNMGLQPSFSDATAPVIYIAGLAGHEGETYIKYRRVCRIYRQIGQREDERMIVSQAEGSCSSWETKYRYRNDSVKCPECGKASIVKGKAEYGGGWLCFKKKGGCGAKFGDKDPAIVSQPVGKIPNPDIADIENTILKMADKRALIAATLLATGCSDIFTQDVEDLPASGSDTPPSPPAANDAEFVDDPPAQPPTGLELAGAFARLKLPIGFSDWVVESIPSCKDFATRKPRVLTFDERSLVAQGIAQIKPQDASVPPAEPREGPGQTTLLQPDSTPKASTLQQQTDIRKLAKDLGWSDGELADWIEGATLDVGLAGKRTVDELTAAEAVRVYESMDAELYGLKASEASVAK